MPTNEKNWTHIRLNKDNGQGIREVAGAMHRSITTETNLAVAAHVSNWRQGAGNAHDRRKGRRAAK